MCDKIRCELFHAFEGHCCPQGVPCPFVPKKNPAKATEVAAAQAAIQRGVFPILMVLLVASAAFFALLATEHHFERVARIDQERIVWK